MTAPPPLPSDTVALLAVVTFVGSFLGALAAPRLHLTAILAIINRRLQALGCPQCPPTTGPITAPIRERERT